MLAFSPSGEGVHTENFSQHRGWYGAHHKKVSIVGATTRDAAPLGIPTGCEAFTCQSTCPMERFSVHELVHGFPPKEKLPCGVLRINPDTREIFSLITDASTSY